MSTKLDPVEESVQRCTQFRGPLDHEPQVRQVAGELLAAFRAGQLTAHDLRTVADCLETGVRRAARLQAV